jgi:hopanoid C-2 methylase
LTINLLQALPKTPLWDRLERENRLNHDESRDSNVEFLLPYDHVVSEWKRVMKVVYAPEKLFERYEYQCDYTYAKRVKAPASTQATWPNIRRGLIMLRNVFWRLGVLGDYKKIFWKFALRRLRKGDIEGMLAASLVGHHLIRFGQEATSGNQNASNYSVRLREAAVPAE